MNESNETDAPQFPESSPLPVAELVPDQPPPRPLGHWVRRFFACNPFYLVSAALLLYGVYRVSTDTGFLAREVPQLLFNFSSLQLYELLLVGTAILLARRRIWYDSTLLVWIENLLVFVPFILVTQAILIDRQSIWIISGIGAGLVILRFGGLKRFFVQLHLPGRALMLGLALLALNVALSVIYRNLLESNKEGTWPTEGPQYNMAKYTWLLILPAAFALGNLLPHFREQGTLLPQRRWLPTGFFALWLAATTVHVYCLDYVYQFKLPLAWIAPGLWVLAWTIFRRSLDLFPVPERPWRQLLVAAPCLLPLLAADENGTWIFLSLAALNAVAYAGLCFRDRHSRLLLHLLAASVLLFAGGVPVEWARHVAPGMTAGKLVALGVVGYLLLWTALSRNPKLAVLASVVVFGSVFAVFQAHAGAAHWALQSAAVFLLLHSLRWDDASDPAARAVRVLAGILWIVHSFVWMHASESLWMASIPGGVVFGVCLVIRWFRRQSNHLVVPAMAVPVMLSGPADGLLRAAHSMPVALLLVIASFLCFGLGTAAALTKHRWHPGGNTGSQD